MREKWFKMMPKSSHSCPTRCSSSWQSSWLSCAKVPLRRCRRSRSRRRSLRPGVHLLGGLAVSWARGLATRGDTGLGRGQRRVSEAGKASEETARWGRGSAHTGTPGPSRWLCSLGGGPRPRASPASAAPKSCTWGPIGSSAQGGSPWAGPRDGPHGGSQSGSQDEAQVVPHGGSQGE